MRVAPDEGHGQNLLLLGQGDREISEGIEGDGNFLADGASQLGFVLPREEIHNFRVVAFSVDVPSLVRHHFVRTAVRLHGSRVRLVDDPIQVLVQTIQEKGQKLLSIVLSETRELRRLWDRIGNLHSCVDISVSSESTA